jgi:hypothetical protein
VKQVIAARRKRGARNGWATGGAPRHFPPGCQRRSALVRKARSETRARDLAPLVWQSVAEGKSYGVIAGEFNESGIAPPQRAPWSKKLDMEDRSPDGRRIRTQAHTRKENRDRSEQGPKTHLRDRPAFVGVATRGKNLPNVARGRRRRLKFHAPIPLRVVGLSVEMKGDDQVLLSTSTKNGSTTSSMRGASLTCTKSRASISSSKCLRHAAAAKARAKSASL